MRRDLTTRSIILEMRDRFEIVRTTVAELHNQNSKYEKGAITCQHID